VIRVTIGLMRPSCCAGPGLPSLAGGRKPAAARRPVFPDGRNLAKPIRPLEE
jgi:hypothetical protein